MYRILRILFCNSNLAVSQRKLWTATILERRKNCPKCICLTSIVFSLQNTSKRHRVPPRCVYDFLYCRMLFLLLCDTIVGNVYFVVTHVYDINYLENSPSTRSPPQNIVFSTNHIDVYYTNSVALVYYFSRLVHFDTIKPRNCLISKYTFYYAHIFDILSFLCSPAKLYSWNLFKIINSNKYIIFLCILHHTSFNNVGIKQ